MDEALLRAVNAWAASPAIAELGVFLSSRWLPALVWIPLGLYLLWRRRLSLVVSIALSCGLADAVNARIVKPVVGRERPCRALTGLVVPARCGVGKSFASGHAAVAFAFATSAAPALPFGAAVFVPVAALVAGSRVLLGQHYPSDIAGGALLGAAFGFGGLYARKRADAWRAARASKAS